MNSIKIIIKNISSDTVIVKNNKIKPNCLCELWVSNELYEELESKTSVEVFTYASTEYVKENILKLKEVLNEVKGKIELMENYLPEYRENIKK